MIHRESMPWNLGPVRLALVLSVWLTAGNPAGRAGTPFNTNIIPGLPATIECETYDQGGQNVGFHKYPAPGNLGGRFRTDGVSIYRCADCGGTLGYCVGDTHQWDWLQYSITNTEAAIYRVDVLGRLAQGSVSPTSFHLEVDNTIYTPSMSLYLFYGTSWQTASALTLTNISVGAHTLKLVIDSGDSNYGAGFFDYMTIYKQSPSSPSPGNPVQSTDLWQVWQEIFIVSS